MKLNLRNVIQEKIRKNVWDIECKLTYHDTKAVIYMNEYTMNLIENIMTRELTMYAKDNGIMRTYEGTEIIIKNELKDFEIEITEKEN